MPKLLRETVASKASSPLQNFIISNILEPLLNPEHSEPIF
jgi:hypothetical protein